MDKYTNLRAAVEQKCSAILIEDVDVIRALLAERDALREAARLALEYWADRQQRYKNRSPVWVQKARAALGIDRARSVEGGWGMSYPEWGTALIECANPPCDWRGLETDMIPDPAPKVAPRGRLTGIENVCPRCKRPGYYFVEEME